MLTLSKLLSITLSPFPFPPEVLYRQSLKLRSLLLVAHRYINTILAVLQSVIISGVHLLCARLCLLEQATLPYESVTPLTQASPPIKANGFLPRSYLVSIAEVVGLPATPRSRLRTSESVPKLLTCLNHFRSSLDLWCF